MEFLLLVVIIVVLVALFKSKGPNDKAATGGTHTPPVSHPAAPKATPKADPFTGVDRDAFARAQAVMSGSKPAPKADASGSFSAAAKAPTKEPPQDTPFQKAVKNYFRSNWDKDGSIYQDLDSMPINSFTVQFREDRIVESISLEGQDIPLVNETMYDTLCAKESIPDLTTEAAQSELLTALTDYLTGLGTLTLRNGAFVPVRTSAPAKPKPSAQPEQKQGGTDYEALRAQMQSMLEQMAKQDKPNK